MLREVKKIMNVVIYSRVSSKEQVENFSLSSQEKLCRDFATKQGWSVLKLFQEEGESARTTNRTQLSKMMEFCTKNRGNLDAVLVYKVDRIARNSADHYAIRALLTRLGIVLRSVTEVIDETATGKLTEGMFSLIAQFDNDQRSERTRAGLMERVRQGLWAWAPPMGYKSSPTGMIVDHEKAPYVIQAFELYSTGNYSIKEISGLFTYLGTAATDLP